MKKLILFSSYSILFFFYTAKAQWQQIGSPYPTPNVSYITYHPNDYFYLATDQNEIFRGNDYTEWVKTSTLNTAIKCLIISSDNVLYAGVSKGYFYSTDLGVTWQEKQLMQYSDSYISDIKIDSLGNLFMNPIKDYSTDSIGVYVSRNNGLTWNYNFFGTRSELSSSSGIEIDSLGNIYFITSRRIYKSIDNGYSWQLLSTLSNFIYDFTADVYANLYVINYISQQGYTILKSSNSGNSWEPIYSGSVYKLYSSNNKIFAYNYSYNFDSTNIVYSSDFGLSWQNIGISGFNTNNLFLYNSNILYAANTRGLRKCILNNNNINWTLCFKYNDRFISINDFEILQNNKWFVGTNEGLYSSMNKGIDWDSSSIFNNTRLVQRDNLGNIYAASGYLYRSTDNGLSWQVPYEIIWSNPNNVYNFIINDSNEVIVNDGYRTHELYVQKSIDNGSTWTRLWDYFVACDATNINYSFLEIDNGTYFLSYYENVHCLPSPTVIAEHLLKKDVNSNWVEIMGNIAYNIYSFNNKVYFATNNGIYISPDNGNTYFQLNNGLSSRVVKQLVLLPEIFIALTGSGIYSSVDNGNYWIRLDHSGLDATINRIYLDGIKNLFACTTNGLYFFSGVLSLDSNSSTKIKEFELLQNFPNPFNPITKIKYQIPKESKITLKVFDILGKEVAQLVDDYRNTGSYEVNFDASSLPSGVYLYKLQAGNFTQTRKMVFLK